jgi:hypothetical protein
MVYRGRGSKDSPIADLTTKPWLIAEARTQLYKGKSVCPYADMNIENEGCHRTVLNTG